MRVWMLAATAAMMGGAAACGSSGTTAAPEVTVTAPAATVTETMTTTTTATASKAAASGDRCRTSDLKADLTYQSAADGKVNSMLTLTNDSGRTCTVRGNPVATVYDASGSPAQSLTEPRAFPGAPTTVTLRPGTTAFAGVQWRSDASCPLAGGVGFSAPQEDGVVKVRARSFGSGTDRWRLCDGKVTVGTLQPASEGVNFG